MLIDIYLLSSFKFLRFNIFFKFYNYDHFGGSKIILWFSILLKEKNEYLHLCLKEAPASKRFLHDLVFGPKYPLRFLDSCREIFDA